MGAFSVLPDQPQAKPPMETPEGLQARLAEAIQQRYAEPAPSGKWESVPQANENGRVTPDLPLEKPQQPDNDPIAPLLTNLVNRYQASAPPPPAHGVKGFLQNFFTGGGEAMMHSQGMRTPADERDQLLTQIFHLSNARVAYQAQLAENELKRAQVANANRPLPPEQAKAIGQPGLAGQIVPPDVLSAASAEATRQQNAKLAEQERADAQLGKPTLQLPLDANTAKLAGVPDQFVGKNLSTADWKLIDARLSAQGYQKQDMGFDGKNGGIWITDRGGNKINQVTPVSESNRAVKALTAGGQAVYAYNPQTNETVLTTQQAASAGGMNSIRPVKETDIRNDLHDSRVLNDIAAKSNQVYQSASAMTDTDIGSTLGAARYLADHPNTTTDQLVSSGIMGNMSPAAKNYVMDIMSLRESAMGLQKVLTGSARANEVQINALLRTLPSLEPDQKTVRDKLQRFTQNITLLRQGIPKMPGLDVVPVQGTSPTANPGGAFNWSAYPAVKP